MEARRGQGWCICFWCSPTGMSLFSRACCFLKQQHMFYLLEWGHVMLHTCWVLWFTSSFSNGSPNCQPFPWPKVVLPTAHGFAALVCGWLHGPVLANYFVHLGAALTSYEFPKGAHYMLTVANYSFAVKGDDTSCFHLWCFFFTRLDPLLNRALEIQIPIRGKENLTKKDC